MNKNRQKIRWLMAVTIIAASMASQAAPWSVGSPTRDFPSRHLPTITTKMTNPIAMQSGMSLDQAIARMQAKYGAKTVRATTISMNGRPVYEIRMRSADGSRVFTVQVDASTGREL